MDDAVVDKGSQKIPVGCQVVAVIAGELAQGYFLAASGSGFKRAAFGKFIQDDIFLGFKQGIESLAGNVRPAADRGNRDRLKTGVVEQLQKGVGDLFLAMSDACIAAQNAVIAAQSLGIGSCYIGDIMDYSRI